MKFFSWQLKIEITFFLYLIDGNDEFFLLKF